MCAWEESTKAVLYCWPGSFLSMVPRLVLLEKKYNEDEYIVQSINASMGETFSPDYLSVTSTGMLPALVLPTAEALDGKKGKNVPKTQTLCGAASIVAFLDQARTPYSARPSDGSRPPPMLSPVNGAERAVNEAVIQLVCHRHLDPNFIELSARDPGELQAKRLGFQGGMLEGRQRAMDRYVADARARLARPPSKRSSSPSREEQLVDFLVEKAASNAALLSLYRGDASQGTLEDFFEASKTCWTVHLPSALGKLEAMMMGPFAAGDDMTTADCYLIVWLARIVAICGGDTTFAGLGALEQRLNGYRIGNKLHAYWGHWIQRSGFRRLALMPPPQWTT